MERDGLLTQFVVGFGGKTDSCRRTAADESFTAAAVTSKVCQKFTRNGIAAGTGATRNHGIDSATID
jgi:hypothetical protein